MYFHMLYENDMLMILDIEQENLKELEIWDKDRYHVLYLHKK